MGFWGLMRIQGFEDKSVTKIALLFAYMQKL